MTSGRSREPLPTVLEGSDEGFSLTVAASRRPVTAAAGAGAMPSAGPAPPEPAGGRRVTCRGGCGWLEGRSIRWQGRDGGGERRPAAWTAGVCRTMPRGRTSADRRRGGAPRRHRAGWPAARATRRRALCSLRVGGIISEGLASQSSGRPCLGGCPECRSSLNRRRAASPARRCRESDAEAIAMESRLS